MGRPKLYNRGTRISVSLDIESRNHARRLAKHSGVSLSGLISRMISAAWTTSALNKQ